MLGCGALPATTQAVKTLVRGRCRSLVTFTTVSFHQLIAEIQCMKTTGNSLQHCAVFSQRGNAGTKKEA